jgi:hypothetical protein
MCYNSFTPKTKDWINNKQYVWLRSLTRNMDISQAEMLLDSFDSLDREDANVLERKKRTHRS